MPFPSVGVVIVGFWKDILQLFSTPSAPPLPTVQTILPPLARTEIQQGRLPNISSNTVFLKSGEVCHFIDKAILLKDKPRKSYMRTGKSTSYKGFFGMRHTINRGQTDVEEHADIEQIRGILYITNKRLIFQATKNGVEKQHTLLTSIAPYLNAVELQYGSTHYNLIVPDGALVNMVLKLTASNP